MCIYHISWQSSFGLCAQELAGVPRVISVQLDANFKAEIKDYGGWFISSDASFDYKGFNIVVGNLLAWFLPGKYIFLVSIVLLISCPIYMYFFLAETVKSVPKSDGESGCLLKTINVLNRRIRTMRDATNIVTDNPTLRSTTYVSFFLKLGMTGITG